MPCLRREALRPSEVLCAKRDARLIITVQSISGRPPDGSLDDRSGHLASIARHGRIYNTAESGKAKACRMTHRRRDRKRKKDNSKSAGIKMERPLHDDRR